MIDRISEILNTLSEEAQQSALAKCQELGFNIGRGVVPLDKSFIDLNEAKDNLMNAIKDNKLTNLPIAIQQTLLSNLEAISRFQANLMAGSDEVVNLVNSIDQLNTILWQYNLQNGSKQLWDYKNKISQVKQLKLETNKLKNELVTGLESKKELEQLIEELKKSKQAIDDLLNVSNENSKKIAESLATAADMQQKASLVLGTIQQNETSSQTILGESKASRSEIAKLESEIEKFSEQVSEYREIMKSTGEKADQMIDENSTKTNLIIDKLSELEAQIIDKLQKATGISLFENYDTRKRDLVRTKWGWVIAIAVLLGISAWWSIYIAEAANNITTGFYLKLSLSVPLIYAIWFCTAQYGKERRLEEEYAVRSNISLSLVPFEEFLRRMIDMEKAPEKEKYTAFIIESLNKIFTSPTDKVFYGEEKLQGLSAGRLKKELSIIEQVLKIFKPQ